MHPASWARPQHPEPYPRAPDPRRAIVRRQLAWFALLSGRLPAAIHYPAYARCWLAFTHVLNPLPVLARELRRDFSGRKRG